MASKKKKTTQTPIAPTPPTSAKEISTSASPAQKKALAHVPAVALLIDGENVVAPDLIAHILVEAGKMGGVTTRHIYGNWSVPSMQPWKKHLAHYGLELIGNRSGQNATDIALVIGAMDLFYRGIKHFCLVAGDSDYVPLVQRLRQDGCTILIIGTPTMSKALKEASTLFVSTDRLLPQAASAPPSPFPVPISPIPASPPAAELSTLLTDAYTLVAQKSGTEWVPLSALGAMLRQCNADFATLYGKQSLSALVKQSAHCFETQKRKVGKGETEEVRLR
jgi:uncharacterized LabA/DUF88 family protein